MGKTGFAALDKEQTPCVFTTWCCNADLPTKSSKMNFQLYGRLLSTSTLRLIHNYF